ncbi:MAG: hypothetical protein L0H31_15255, partial [Nocardioidaceae bacterium]|nr:hypothetical protein [Nocardioidaceae bacterium]
MPSTLGRRLVAFLVAVSLVLLLAACSGETAEKAKAELPPATGAQERPALLGQWRYQSVITPKKKRVRLAGTNVWLRLGVDGVAQGQDGRPWLGSYNLDK